ncbi:T9SS type B sorting domain-containing protein [Pareuzebyella sediminis]|uniref:T9SS type B sorting domain-containing protein n=1 Tax=Pareuzebyella sediminis TaxID=2607998 RepID=UPI0011ED0A59|nr:T9SS type B sorting domain-containing protein [Pareuzebyella sediminis]
MNRKILFLLLGIGFGISVNAQLSNLHYLPPLKQGRNNQAIQQQAVYLSTPEPTTFVVNAYRGTSLTPEATFNISNNSPAVYSLPNGDNNITLVDNNHTGVVLNNSGLRFESPSGNKFYVNYRGYSSAQAASLTSKGRVAMGRRFRWGGVPNLGAHVSKSNTLGIMATEDNTTITLSGYDPNCVFRVGGNIVGITANTHTVTLNANESFVYENYRGNNPTAANRDGWIGAAIVSDKDIVISNGSMNFGRQENNSNRDAGIDQPVPENRLGKEYVFVRGNGNTNGWTEFPLLIAIADNTQIFVNGSTTPIATLNAGDYFEIPSSFYSSNSVGANMFVQTSKDVYAYQCMAGASQVYTQGLNFVAPVNCLLPDVMDNIPDIRNMAGQLVTGGMTIIAAVNTPDANIQVTDGNGPVALPAHVPVAGSSDWKTFFIPNLTGNVSVQSTGPMAIGFFGYNGARGVAGYFSGFDTVPEVTLEIRGGKGCFVGSEIYEATGNFDAYQWYFDGQPVPGANGPSFAPTVAGDYFVRGTKGPCTYDSQSIQALYCDPDVIINKTVDNPEIMEGETATFTIRVRNLGVGPLTNLQITDNIPAGLTLESSYTITGTWSGTTWNIGTLNGGETALLELEVSADEIDTLPLLSLTNTAINSQDQTDSNTTPDNPSARIVVHNDFDNDGIRDVTDLDDDNDGIYDTEECNNLSFTISGGNPFNSDLASVDNYLVLDLFSMDNSFNLQFNGNDVAGEVQFQPGATGNFAEFLDGTRYGQDGIPQIYTLTGSHGSPLLRVVINEAGQFELFGARTSNGQLEPMILTTPPNSITWNTSGNNTITVNQNVVGPTNMSGILLTAGCDTDNDGFPDQLDLDSDGDGCSDANEFYKDNNADGGDDGFYGAGIPAVNANDGKVNAASYIRVYAPEILLGNTTENLGGTDINGQDVSLGQTIQYVLRFQNTGDDHAQNVSIMNLLPQNVTLDNVDTSNATGTTYAHDITTNTLNFDIPNSLVQVGDPQYSIRITVTIAGNCSEFVAACSSQLENRAYLTYQGTLNSNTFSDEPGNGPISACASTPEIALNSIFNDLENCEESRTVQLCGASVILMAGQGYSSYNWVFDTNGNGVVDSGESPLNDGNPDNDPSTLLVTTIGDYIVQKSSDGSCPDRMERVKVERFGETQTNPIIDYFNQVNADNNPDNDMQGEIATCTVDGDAMPKLFLCGANDTATIQLGITDAQSITWQKLDENSCSDAGEDCATKNGTCLWNTVGSSDNFTLSDSGEYRVVINYQNGCFSRFHFKVFKNNLVLDHNATDILCSTPGHITVTNVGSGYGFQLIDVNTDTIIVPFSANNGPNFDISNSGVYKVQVTQLDPANGTPILGSCIFETEDIGILERNFQVNLATAPANCSTLGSIEIQALNVTPIYSYELRRDDGSNGGQGSLISTAPARNDNTHTFSGVAPGNYLVTTRTDDGCFDTQNITVDEIPELTLTASVADHITCNPGVITLTPGGGQPNSSYSMAIWSKDGIPLYSDPSNIPLAAVQTTNSFLFGHRGNPSSYYPNEDGDYTFIVMDSNGCYNISNTVRIQDLGSPSINASHTQITCADSATSTLTVNVTGGTAPYQYSLDGGTTFQNTNRFLNLPSGFYEITVMDYSGNGSNACTATINYEIDQPFRLTASPSILEDASCDPSGALVKILNPNGGQFPYEFSFDGGSSFSAIDNQRLLPGTYQLAVRDAIGCTYPMEIIVPNPVTDPTFAQAVDYDCLGEGTITITPSNTTDFDFSYSLNSTLNSPSDNNTFANILAGTNTVTVTYVTAVAPDQSTLFFEDFGSGPNTQIGEVGPGYCYEPQDGSATACNLGPAGILVDGEYSVTHFVTNPIPAYRNPNDHTSLTDGRFLSIHPSNNLVGSNSIIWARRALEVLPNRDIDISFWAYNLRQTGSAGNNPEIQVELLDAGGNVIDSMTLPEIPKNTNADDWHNRSVTFNPGVNTTVDIVLRSNQPSDDGNELILDDIQASQPPKICEKTTDIVVVVEGGQAFEATLLSTIDPKCNGGSDGAVRFAVSNFDATTGFEYSMDGGASWTTSLVSPVTTAANLTSGNYTLQVRKVAETSCTSDFNATLNDPSPLVPQLAQVEDYTCFNTGGTLEASATGGNPAYEYQLENTLGQIISHYQINARFTNIADGDYVVRVRDQNGCSTVTTNPVTIAPTETIIFDLSATDCYDGQNNAEITVNVTAGNGGYQFRINGGVWVTPTPATEATHTFNGLSEGSYAIEVRDRLGCPTVSNLQTIEIHPPLVVDVVTEEISSCGDGSITVNATGGNGTLRYAIVPANTVPTGFFSATSTLTVTDAMATANPAGYDVYVEDNSGSPSLCNFLQEDIILTPSTPLSLSATPTDPECFGGLGQIDVTVGGGKAPFTYTLTDLSAADGIDYGRSNTNVSIATLAFNGIGAGNYEITITDTNGCTTSSSLTIANAIEITADIVPILPAACTSTIESDFGFEFQNVISPSGTVEYSNDGGATWQTSAELRGSVSYPTFSGTEVFPSIRVEVSPGVFCQKDFDRYIIPFPLDDLDITLSAIVIGCNDLQVTVEGSEGNPIPGYEYTYTDDPANFTTFITDPNVWTPALPSGTSHTFANIDPTTPQYPEVPLLIPGRTYVFYVRDGSGCIRQSSVDINEIPLVNLPIEITPDVTPTCFGTTTGAITFTITPDTSYPNFRWEIYELGNTTPIETSGGNVPFSSLVSTSVPLGEGEYYIEVTQIQADNITVACKAASENVFLEELAPISATATATRDISCNLPGLITVTGITGGGGHPYSYDVSGPSGFTSLTGTTDNPVEIPVNSPSGDYTVTLYDQYNCPVILNTVTLSLTPNPLLSVTQDNCTAPITVTATGSSAIGNLRYAMVSSGDPAPTTFNDNAGIFNNIAPGTYDFYVTDGNGCITSELGFVVYPTLSASASLSKVIDCTLSPEAIITIDITEGSAAYEYSITNTAGAPAISKTSVPGFTFDYSTSLPGDYTITIYDTNTPDNANCNRTFTVTVQDRIEPVIDPAILTEDVSCSGNTDGSITIATNAGNAAPYTFMITSMDGTATSILPTSTTGISATFTGLAPTTSPSGYIVTVTGDPAYNNCSVTSGPIEINEPAAITFNANVTEPFACTSGNTMENALIEIDLGSISGGTNSYTRYEFIEVGTGNVLQNGSNHRYTYTNVAGGDIIIRIYDENGCSGERTVNVPPYDTLGTPTIHIDDAISCSNLGEDISLDISCSVTSFTTHPSNYEFRQLPSGAYQASNQFTDLQPGNYTFAVRNIATNCEITVNHTVSDPNTFGASVNKISDVACYGDNGSITITVTDPVYSGSFSWSIFNTNGTPSDRSDDGTAVTSGTLSAVGTTPGIALPGGNYIVEVLQDAFPECGQVRSFTITTPAAPLTLDAISLSEVGCSNDRGSASIKPLGGLAPYDIQLTNTTIGSSWNENGVNAHLFTSLSAGQYSILVTDALGCSRTFTNEFELLLPDPISGTVSTTALVCENGTDASISISVGPRNISSNYRYRLRNYSDMTGTTLIGNSAGQTSITFNDLGAGFYSIFIEDDLGCTFESPIREIVNPTEVSVQLSMQQSLGCQTDAILVLSAQGGTAPYSWSIDGITFNPMNGLNGSTTHVFQNVGAGTYHFYVRDMFNCVSTISNEVEIASIENMTLEVNKSASVVNCNGDHTGAIYAQAAGGLGSYRYALFTDQAMTNNYYGVGYEQTDGEFFDLPAGTYYVNVVSDDCTVVPEEVIINEPSPLSVVNPQDYTDITCTGANDGTISVELSGGTGPYQYAISPHLNKFDHKNTFDGLQPGSYTVIAQDQNGCFIKLDYTLVEPAPLTASATSLPEICDGEENGAIELTLSGGTAPYSTRLSQEIDFVQGRTNITDLAGGDYIVYVRDAQGCEVNVSVSIESGASLDAYVEPVYGCNGYLPNNYVNIVLDDPSISDEVLYGLDSTDPNNMQLNPFFRDLNPGTHTISISHANGCIRTYTFEIENFEPLTLSVEQSNLNEITATVTGGKENYTFYFNDLDNGDTNTFYIKRTDTYLVRVVDENGCEATASIYMEFIDIEIPNFFTPNGDGQNDFWKPKNIEQFPDIFIKIFDRYGRQVFTIKDNEEGWNGLYQESNLPSGDYWYIIKLNGEDDDREFMGHFTLYR